MNKRRINKFCNSLEEKRFYNTYGKVFIVNTKSLTLVLDLILPMFWVIALLIPKRFNKEFARITIRSD